jgi:hypothetical protein
MASNNHQKILNIESELNCLKRERDLLPNDRETKRRALLNEMKIATPQRSVQLINEIAQLQRDYDQRLQTIERKIYETRMEYFKALREN